MHRSAWLDDRDALSQAFVRGMSRGSIVVPEPFKPTADASSEKSEAQQQLDLLAALALRQRFDLPTMPTEFADEEQRLEVTPMQGELRTFMLRYFSNAKRDIPALAIRRVFSMLKQHGLHIHPFDYVALRHLANLENRALMDTAFVTWAGRGSKDKIQPTVLVNEDNWLDFSMSVRRNFIAELHRQDGSKARALLQAHITSETAMNRVKLLESLQESVTIADIEFLNQFTTDRAKTVKELAVNMLALLPGSEQYNERLEEAGSRLVLRKVRGKKAQSVRVDHPKNLKKYRLDVWYETTYSGVDPAHLSQCVEMDTPDFVKNLADSRLAQHCFTFLANAGEVTLAQMVLDEWREQHNWIENNHQLLSLSDEMTAVCWHEIAHREDANAFWSWLDSTNFGFSSLRLPMPVSLATELLSRPYLQAGLPDFENDKVEYDDDVLDTLVSIFPTSCFTELSERFEGVSPRYATTAKNLLKLLAQIDQ